MAQTPIPPIPPSTPPPQAAAQSSNRTLMLVLSYLGILAIVPLLVEKDDREVQWHAKHGLVLFVAEIILFFALGIVLFVLGNIPYLGWIISALGCLIWVLLPLGILALHIVAIMKALKGERLIVPMVSEYASKF